MFSLGVIPARGGSKRLPGKNIRMMAGKPLIAWTIEEAHKSKLSHVIVSTDDITIADVAHSYGADVPFVRPPELATDDAKSVDVMIHAAKWCESNLEKPDYVFLLQPTSPTRTKDDIDIAVAVVESGQTQGYVTVHQDGSPNGLIYASSWDLLTKDRTVWNGFSTQVTYACEVPDIDTEEDWKKAEAMLCK